MINTSAVIGAGVMGKGIARHLATAGCKVTLIDSDTTQLAKANHEMTDSNVHLSSDIEDCHGTDYVIEAVTEDLDLKRDLLTRLSRNLTPKTIIATNTSSLLIRDLAIAVTGTERFLGVHYNNPADFNPIVEIIPTTTTKHELTHHILRWYQESGKQTVLCMDTSGFVLNRQSLPYMNEAVRCLDIAKPGSIDEAAKRELGVDLGPFAVMNLVGLKVMAAASKNLALLGEGYRTADLLLQKSAEKNPVWEINSDADLNDIDIATVRDRLLGAMLFPGRDILARSLCSREDLHVICVGALGYQHSSPELLDQLPEPETNRLIATYLASEIG